MPTEITSAISSAATTGIKSAVSPTTSVITGGLQALKSALLTTQTQLNSLSKKTAEAQALYAKASAKAIVMSEAAKKIPAPFQPPGQTLIIVPPNPQSLVKVAASATATVQGASKLIPNVSSVTSLVPGGSPFVPNIPSTIPSTKSTEIATTELVSSTIFKKFVS